MRFAEWLVRMMTANTVRWTARGIGVLLMVALPGCVGYRLGSMLPPDVQTVYVPTFVNRTSELLVEVETTQAVLEELQLDGSLRVVPNEDEADSVLDVTVYGFDLTPIEFDRGRQRTRAEAYRLTLTAAMTLKRPGTGEIIAQYPVVRGDADFELLGDLTSSKRRALPDAAEDLAHDIVESMVEVW